MSPSIQTMGFFMSEINFCNTKEQLVHIGEVTTGKVDGSPSGSDISTSTLPYTGQVRKTLPALEAEYLSAIRSAGGDDLNGGVWASGQTFTAYNQYMVYNGVPYKPKTTTTLSYGPTGATPDFNFVQPYVEISSSDLQNPNLIDNSNLEVFGSVTNIPDATPRAYSADDELFLGFKAVGSLTGVTYINGTLGGTGQLYVDVVKTAKMQVATSVVTASVAGSGGSPTTTGVTVVDNGSSYRVTFDISGVFSVKLEQGSRATRHDVRSKLGVDSFTFNSVSVMKRSQSPIGSVVRVSNSNDKNLGTDGVYDVISSAGVVSDGKYIIEDEINSGVSYRRRIGAGSEDNEFFTNKLYDVIKKMRDGSVVKIVALGDSITALDYATPLQALLRDYHQNSNITVVKQGFSGFRSDQILAQWPTAVTAEDPDLVVLMAGMNDAIQDTSIDTFVSSMLEMYKNATLESRAIVSMNITPNSQMQELDSSEPEKRINDYRSSGDALAKRLCVPHLDLNRALLNTMGKSGFNWFDIYADRVHPNAVGFQQVAGALFCKMLAGEDLTLSINGKLSPVSANFVYTPSVVSNRDTALDPNVTNVRLKPTLNTDGAFVYFWVDDYKGRCQFVINATREEVLTSEGRQPRLFINNDFATEPNNSVNIKLGEPNATIRYSTRGVPVTGCVVRPGINKIALLPLLNGVAEISTCYITNDSDPYYNHLNFTESFGPKFDPRSYEISSRDNLISKIIGKGELSHQAITTGKTVTLGNAAGASIWSFLQRLRLNITEGFTLFFSPKSEFAREESPAFALRFNMSGADLVVTSEAALMGSTTFVAFDSVTRATTPIGGDKKLDILSAAGDGATAGDTSFYLDNVLVGTMPFNLGNGIITAFNPDASAAYVNQLITFSPDSPLFGVVEGEEWIEFTTPAKKMVVGGSVKTISMS